MNSGSPVGTPAANCDMAFYMANLAKDQGRTPDAVKFLKDAINTVQPFAYRKPAEAMLAQLAKTEKSASPKAEKAAGAKPAESAAKSDPPKTDTAKPEAAK